MESVSIDLISYQEIANTTLQGQLRKMGILSTEKKEFVSPVASRRKSTALDFGNLKPLNAEAGTKNFGGYRDPGLQSPKSKQKEADAMDSDADDDDEVKTKVEDVDEDKEVGDKGLLSPEDALRQGELAEGVRKIKVRHYILLLNISNYMKTDLKTAETPTLG